MCEQHEVEFLLQKVSEFLEGTNMLLVLNDCAASKDVKRRTGQLVTVAFSAHHFGFTIWVLTQRYTSITPSFWDNVVAVLLFYIPCSKTTKAIFKDYASEMSLYKYRYWIGKLKERKFSCLVFSLRHPFRIKYFSN